MIEFCRLICLLAITIICKFSLENNGTLVTQIWRINYDLICIHSHYFHLSLIR